MSDTDQHKRHHQVKKVVSYGNTAPRIATITLFLHQPEGSEMPQEFIDELAAHVKTFVETWLS